VFHLLKLNEPFQWANIESSPGWATSRIQTAYKLGHKLVQSGKEVFKTGYDSIFAASGGAFKSLTLFSNNRHTLFFHERVFRSVFDILS